MKYAIAFLAAALFLVACSQTATQAPSDTSASGAQERPAEPSNLTVGQGPPPAQLAQTFDVQVTEWSYSPDRIVVKEGTQVTVNVKNVGTTTHGFALPEFNVNQAIPPGEERTVTFRADKKGTYRIFCSVPCGSGHQTMNIVLVVE